MELTSRPAAHEDFSCFFDACYHAARADQQLRRIVEREWQVLLSSQASLSLVVEDLSRSPENRFVGCAQLVFVTESFVRLTQDLPEPWVNARLVRAAPGSSSFLLTRAQIARANASAGLSALFTRWHRADWHLSYEEMLEIGIFMHTAFQDYACGYRFREILAEATGERARDLALRAGFHLRCDYAAYYAACPPVPPPVSHPFLMGITHAEAIAADSSMMGHYFVYRSPKLDLTSGQQGLLELCLRQPDLSDVALAAVLGVTVHHVKNSLRAAYARISDVAFELLPEPGNGQRGPEKKRQLISYLREHPEELRPYQR